MARSLGLGAMVALSCAVHCIAFHAPMAGSGLPLRRQHCSLTSLSCAAKPPAPAPRSSSRHPARHIPASAASLATLLVSTAALAAEEASDQAAAAPFVPPGITALDTGVFIAGCVPFVWAGISFWTRIVNGEPFGTGKDSVVIDTGREDWKAADGTGSSRILSAGALRLAYVLMAAAGVSVAAVFYAAQQLPATLTPPS